MFWHPSGCCYVVKDLIHAFSCAYIELDMLRKLHVELLSAVPVLFLHFCALPAEITCCWSINAAWLSCWILSELVLVSVIQVWVRLSLIFLKIIWYHLALFVADDNNTRVLFEKVLSSMPKDKARFVVDNLNYLVNFLWVGCGTELGFCKTITDMFLFWKSCIFL